MGCRNLAHVVLDVGPSARSSQQVPAAIQYADAAPLAPRLACLGLPPVAVPAAGEVVCCTWAGASCRPAPARRTAPCVAPPSPPPPMHALLPMLPVPRPDPQPSFLPSCPAWTSAPPRPISVPPPGRPRPRLPRRLPTCPRRPHSVPGDPPSRRAGAGCCQPAPAALQPRRQAAAPWPPAYADLSTLAGRAPVGPGCRPPAPLLGVKPPSSPPPAPLQPPPRRQTAPARPNSYIQTTGPPPQWSG